MSVNSVILIGNLGKDPELRRLNNGNPVCNFSLATSERWRSKDSGEKQEKTTWHNVVIFDENLCQIAEKYLRKGSKVYLRGSLQTREYEKDGSKRYVTEVVLQRFRGELVMLDGKSEGGGGHVEASAQPETGYRDRNSVEPELDDSIPFISW